MNENNINLLTYDQTRLCAAFALLIKRFRLIFLSNEPKEVSILLFVLENPNLLEELLYPNIVII
jgi:hypothetical protein